MSKKALIGLLTAAGLLSVFLLLFYSELADKMHAGLRSGRVVVTNRPALQKKKDSTALNETDEQQIRLRLLQHVTDSVCALLDSSRAVLLAAETEKQPNSFIAEGHATRIREMLEHYKQFVLTTFPYVSSTEISQALDTEDCNEDATSWELCHFGDQPPEAKLAGLDKMKAGIRKTASFITAAKK